MAIELNTDENLFGDTISTAPDIDRDTLSRALYHQLKDISLERFVDYFTNSFEAVVDYANLSVGEKTGQRISLLFNPHRLDTGTKRFPISLYQALKDERFIHGLARVVLLNKKKGATKDLLYASVGMGVQGTSYVQEFPPHVARDLALEYGLSKFCKVLDPCAGWGGRMLGFSTVVDYYVCCEPSTRTAAGLRQLLTFINSFRSQFRAVINEAPFEDVTLPENTFDFAMTSPPYYDTERYAPGEAANSFNRYATFQQWCDGFYAPLIHRTMAALKPGACFVINIGSRLYPLNDKLFEICRDKYDVQKQQGKLSASNGLGKSGEGETFYEIKKHGVYVSPDEHVAIELTAVSPVVVETALSPDRIDAGATSVELADIVAAVESSSAPDAPELPQTVSQNETLTKIVVPVATSFDPPVIEDKTFTIMPRVDALSFALDVLNAPQDVQQAVPKVVESAVETVRSTEPHEVIALMLSRGHEIFARQGKLIITSASTLTDEDRALIREHKPALLIMAPTYPEPDAPKQSLIQFLGEQPEQLAPSDWKLEAPPILDGIDEIEMDFETDGVKWYAGDRPVGVAVRLPDGRKKYYPFAHQGGGNLDEEMMKRWAREQLRNKRITNAYTGFEVHMSREWGVDLCEQGCSFSDVMHYAALLDDHRKKFNLNVLAKDFLGREKEGMDLDPTRMKHYEPWVVARRAEGDVETVAELKQVMWKQLDAQDLQRVRQLEDGVIPVVCEMEKNGAPINMDLLAQMTKDSEEHYYRLIKEVSAEAGFNFDDSDAAWQRLFEKYQLPVTFLDSGKPTFKDAIVARIDHPTIKKARFAAQIDSLRSKVFLPYTEMIGADGILRFDLHQLRIDDEKGQRGTVSGRFSAPYIQQVPNHDNHFETFGELYFPRELYLPGAGLFLAGDAAQIEYRIFASHAKTPKIIDAYRKDPKLSFHKLIHPMITKFKPDFTYSNQKNLNFMRIYGGGTIKTAVMMGFITDQEGEQIRAAKAQRTSPKLAQAREIEAIYNRELPEVEPLLKKAMHLAQTECDQFCHKGDALHREFKHRGYVKTVLGRRGRFPNNYKIYKALNSIIQGSAADIMKTKLVELYRERKALNFTMRMTIHDEVCGDVPDVESAKNIEALLNRQSIEMLVPILWSVGTGHNWAEAK